MLNFQEMFKKLPEIKIQSWAVMIGLIVAALLVSILVKRFGKNRSFDTRKLTYGSLCVALAFVLSYIRIFKMPQGGSVTLGSMIPIMFFAFLFGPAEGILAGMVYGILQFIQEPFSVHWFQVILDYPFAFGALGIAGYFRKNFALGVTTGIAGRFVFNFLSGVFFFGEYAPAGQSPIVYSALYNGTFLAAELAITLVIVFIPQFKNAIGRIKAETV